MLLLPHSPYRGKLNECKGTGPRNGSDNVFTVLCIFSYAQVVEEMLPCMKSKSRGGSGTGIPPAE